MYPWKQPLESWADITKLRIDALGIITMLGSEEINASIGRLVPSHYIEYLPLLGAFVIASDRFRTKTPGFTLYEMNHGFKTTELSGWLSRWLKAQNFHQVHHKVEWTIRKKSEGQSTYSKIGPMLIGFLLHGILLAAAILSQDWWGLANVLSMVVSVVVRGFVVRQNCLGIDNKIDAIEQQRTATAQKTRESLESQALEDVEDTTKSPSLPPETNGALQSNEEPDLDLAKAIVVMDDSKVVTMVAPEFLIAPIFAGAPDVPNPRIYALFLYIGWLAFAVQVIALGMANLLIQMSTVVLLILSSVLAVSKFGCDDSKIWKSIRNWRRRSSDTDLDPLDGMTCLIGSRLEARCSRYGGNSGTPHGSQEVGDAEKGFSDELHENSAFTNSTRRQDLYVWLELSKDQEDSLKKWDLLPHDLPATKFWWDEYRHKKQDHATRQTGQ
jgi:hypothetical protein